MFLRMPRRILSCCFFLVAVAPAVQAYDPETGHLPLSSVALDMYGQCFPEKQIFLNHYRADILAGDAMMDEGVLRGGKQVFSFWHSLFVKHADIFEASERVFNWHFYNPEREALADIGVIDQSLVGLYQKAQLGFVDNRDRSDKVFFMGALAHLTEDLTVPAHVVPVYHGPVEAKLLSHGHIRPFVEYMKAHFVPLNDKLGAPLLIKDPVDAAPVDMQQLPGQVAQYLQAQGTTVCGYLAQHPISTLDNFRDEVARHTLMFLETTTIERCEGLVWGDFWKKPEGTDYFGYYNTDFGNPLFNQPGTLVRRDKTCVFMGDAGKPDARYTQFVTQLHIFAVLDDLRLLDWETSRW